MAKQSIGIGASANSGAGDPIRTAFDKTNQNFTELYDYLAGLGRATAPTPKSFWADIDGVSPNSWRIRDRIFVGAAVDTNDNRVTGSVQPAWGSYANWAPRDSDLSVMSSRGALAITGMSRSSDAVNGGGVISTWGVGGLVVVDRESSTARALYADVQLEPAASVGYGIEVAVKNKGANATTTPYFATNGTFGAVFTAGGDPTYGGAPANPCNSAIYIRGNGLSGQTNYKWNRGIVFDAFSLTGTDGDGSGFATAIEFGAGQSLEWRTSGNSQGAYIYSAVLTAGADVGILFTDNTVRFRGSGGANVFRAAHVVSGVNYLQAQNAATGAAPGLVAQGGDTDVDISFTPAGAGKVKFGVYTALAAESLAGYITIKDAAGNLRKIGVVA